jgi:hypothetical protein
MDVSKLHPATKRNILREWGTAAVLLAILVLVGVTVGWPWAFAGLVLVWLRTLAGLVGVLMVLTDKGAAEQLAPGNAARMLAAQHGIDEESARMIVDNHNRLNAMKALRKDRP